MHRVVLNNQPAVAVIVTLLVLVTKLNEELAEPLTDLDHKRYRAIEDVSLHLGDDRDGSELTKLGGIVLSLLVVDA